MSSPQHIDEFVEPYVLGALEPDEVRTVEEHVMTCARCRALVESARTTATMLLFAPRLVTPPPSLRAKVLDRVRQAAAADRVADTQPRPAIPPIPFPAPPPRTKLPAWLDGLLGRQDADPALSTLSRLLENPASAVWSVNGTDAAPAAKARFVGDPEGREGVLVATGLRPLAPDQAYQVWLLRDGQPIPGNLFKVRRDGTGRLIVRASTRLRDYGVIAITPEPASGSPAPTGAIVLAGELVKQS